MLLRAAPTDALRLMTSNQAAKYAAKFAGNGRHDWRLTDPARAENDL
jgi:hypothetical protein